MHAMTSDLLTRIESLEVELARLKTLAKSAPDSRAEQDEPAPVEPSTSRRDLLRYGAVALGAAATAGMNASRVDAADGGSVIIGANNVGTNATIVSATTNYGVYGSTTASGYAGIAGDSPYFGTYGTTGGQSGVAVFGFAHASSGNTEGVRGHAFSVNGVGVRGINAAGGNAVRAEVPAYSGANGIAMYALNYSAYTGGSPGAGGFAIYGLSSKGHGLVGATASPGAAAVVGATNGVAGAYAAAFYGPVIVGGDFTVVGGAKSAAVPHPDGSHRRLYCVESPESWFEDFGRGTLACGGAHIRLDPDFAAVVDTADYHVFLTGHHGRCDLSVGDRTAEGFHVQSAADMEGTFSWRVVAKRKDIRGARFEPVAIPKEPTLPDVPASAFEEVTRPPDVHKTMAGATRGSKTRT
jgi:hypothetical protein